MFEDLEEEEEEEININSLDMKDRSSWTALHYAAKSGHHKCVEALIEEGADPHLKNSKTMVNIQYF